MVRLLKLLLFFVLALSCMPSQSMQRARNVAQRVVTSRTHLTVPTTSLRINTDAVTPKLERGALVTRPCSAMKLRTSERYLCSSNVLQTKKQQSHYSFNQNKKKYCGLIGWLTLLGVSTKLAYDYAVANKESNDIYADARAKYDEYLLSLPWGEVARKYIAWRDETQQELIREFCELVGCSQEEWMRIYKNTAPWKTLLCYYWFDHGIDEEGLTISDPLNQAIIEALTLAHIDPKIVKWKIAGLLERANSLMATNQSRLYISPYIANTTREGVSASVKKVLMHEMQHLLWEDSLHGSNIFLLTKIFSANLKNFDSAGFSLKVDRFFEKRADIFACLANIEFAESYYERLFAEAKDIDPHEEEMMSKDPHDTIKNRLAYTKQLYEEMLTEIEKNKGSHFAKGYEGQGGQNA